MFKCEKQKKSYECNSLIITWALLGMIQRPPDYESGALTS